MADWGEDSQEEVTLNREDRSWSCVQWLSLLCVCIRCCQWSIDYLFWSRSILNVAAMCLLINTFSFVACYSFITFLVLLVWVLAPIMILKADVIEVRIREREQTLHLRVPFNNKGRFLAQPDSTWIWGSNGEEWCLTSIVCWWLTVSVRETQEEVYG